MYANVSTAKSITYFYRRESSQASAYGGGKRWLPSLSASGARSYLQEYLPICILAFASINACND